MTTNTENRKDAEELANRLQAFASSGGAMDDLCRSTMRQAASMLASAPAQPVEIEALRTELQLTKETHLAVVRRLQKELDETKKALELFQKHERSAQYQIDEDYRQQQREDERMSIQCGGNDGPY